MVEVLVKLSLPKDWRRFKLPRALDARLKALLDRQDRGGKLSAIERREAKALAELVDLLSFLKLRTTEPAGPRSRKRRTAMPTTRSRTTKRPRREPTLGETLRRIRALYIAEGGKLLSMDEIDREVANRRGERCS